MFSTPAVAGDLLIVGSCNSMVRALNRHSGELVWEHDASTNGLQTSFHGDPLILDGTFFTGTDGENDDGVYAIALETGELQWKTSVVSGEHGNHGVVSDVLSSNGKVYVTSLADHVYCLERASGEEVWSYQSSFVAEGRVLNGSPSVHGGVVYFGGLDGTLNALNSENGDMLWTRTLGGGVSTSIYIRANGIICGTEDGKIQLVDLETGEATRTLDLGTAPTSTIVESEGALLVGAKWYWGDPELICVDTLLANILWRLSPNQDAIWSTPRPYVYDECLFLGDTRGVITEYQIKDAALKRTTELTGVIRGIRVIDEVMYVGNQSGMIFAVDRGQP